MGVQAPGGGACPPPAGGLAIYNAPQFKADSTAITGNSSFKHSKRCKIMPKMQQNTFGGRAPPGPAWGAFALPQTL